MSKPKEIKHYTVKVETLVPATIIYQISAESPQDAMKKIEQSPSSNKPKLEVHHNRKKINLKAKVYKQNTTTMELTKSYR